MSVHQKHSPKTCPRTGRPVQDTSRRRWWLPWVFPFLGVASLLWFLIRVIPKPSRAAYPCQRLAAPLASSFILWLLGVCATVAAWYRARDFLRRSRLALAAVAVFIGLISAWMALSNSAEEPAQAAYHPANQPIGVARGLNPGRVAWVHDPAATTWDGQSLGQVKGYWGRVASDPDQVVESYTDQAVVDAMMTKAICWLAGEQDIYQAWDSLIKHFNSTKGKGAVGYQPGEKVNIKINLTTTSGSLGWVVNTSGTQTRDRQYASPSVEVMISLLRQLTLIVGVDQSDITMGDTTGTIPNHVYNQLVDAGFDEVVYICKNALPGRVVDTQTSEVLKFSGPGVGDMYTPVPSTYANADYFINLAILKTHARAGVTMCAKNMYGSMIRTPAQGGYYDLHASLACNVPEEGSYRGLVDLMGHEKFGGNQLLCIVDALWGGYDWSWVSPPIRWQTPPFNDHWCSSLLVSQDPVAIDSVGYDIWWAESEVTTIPGSTTSPYADPRMQGADDYLHEAALADSPASGTFYDPENDGTRLASLGAHEHWNNRFDRQYSRNLGTGDGIELITGPPVDLPSVKACHVFYNQSKFDGDDAAPNAEDDGAIASDKQPLLPGGTATFANYTSYSRGINAIMVDIANPANAGSPTAADFEFHVGNTPLIDPGTPVLEADFDSSEDGFTYADDAFRSTVQPGYASGERVTTGGYDGTGGLRVYLGNLDDQRINGMSGGWAGTFSGEGAATLNFRCKLVHAGGYETDEYGEVLVSVDGNLKGLSGTDYVVRIVGDGNSGPDQTTGWQQYQIDLGTLPAGTHTLRIGGYNNIKSYNDEWTEVVIDDVQVVVAGDDPPAWAAGPTPQSVTVRTGEGVDDSDRVTLIWPDNEIEKQWLRVTVKATENTGLAEPYVFYFGNAIGETGNSGADARVTPADEIGARNNPHTLAMDPADILDVYDFNRDGKVGPTDEILARNHATNASTGLILLEAP